MGLAAVLNINHGLPSISLGCQYDSHELWPVKRKRQLKPISLCSVDDCGREMYATGHCKRHYMQTLRHGKPTPEREHGRVVPCAAPNCSRNSALRGYCRRHDRQVTIYGRLTPEREYTLGLQQCDEPGCSDPVRAKGRCAKHYNRSWRRTNDAGASP